jgi:hypothetical protein
VVPANVYYCDTNDLHQQHQLDYFCQNLLACLEHTEHLQPVLRIVISVRISCLHRVREPLQVLAAFLEMILLKFFCQSSGRTLLQRSDDEAYTESKPTSREKQDSY